MGVLFASYIYAAYGATKTPVTLKPGYVFHGYG